MKTIHVEVWLYGPVARYAGEESKGSHAQLDLELTEGCTLEDVLNELEIPAEERGIIFVSGNLAALPGMEDNLDLTLEDGERIGIFHRRSMWPFQYRFGAAMTPELEEAMNQQKEGFLHHTYTSESED